MRVSDILEIDLKVASKFLATKFSCGASVTGEDEIVIQGDVKDDLFDTLTEKWPQVRASDFLTYPVSVQLYFIVK